MRLLFIGLLLLSSSAYSQCVNQLVCANNECNYVDVCDSYSDQQSVFEDIKPYTPPAYGSSGYSAYDEPTRCYDKYVNGSLIQVCN